MAQNSLRFTYSYQMQQLFAAIPGGKHAAEKKQKGPSLFLAMGPS
jgi:hypothetical protein